ncbi:MAG: 30S ribosomal protein S6 [Clostridiales bacterium]|nr:30S ribosomal protein S6 [Clostridiales bacterium]MBQ2816731.1 30S ribosomal protein S6 [Clostridia bacterium]MBQ4638485.1 30S ribosomal protein S6 [Clostridia bacterium]
MFKYEAMYIIDANVEDEQRKELIEKFNALVVENGGTVTDVDEWGKRHLAYAIDYKTEGYYVLMHFEAAPTFPREFERNLQINDSVLRYLVLRLED